MAVEKPKPRVLTITQGLAKIDERIEQYMLGTTPSMFDESNHEIPAEQMIDGWVSYKVHYTASIAPNASFKIIKAEVPGKLMHLDIEGADGIMATYTVTPEEAHKMLAKWSAMEAKVADAQSE